MLVKFHARGRGGGSGPVDYLLGKDRNREGATVLQGKPEEVRELIDASPYAKKYTSGVLSFEESELAPGQREKLMESFERVLMPGLDKDQYSVLWVEHGDKGRVELNFVIPNTELLTGKRLQPYYDRADRPRIEAWQTVVNGRMGFSDPNDPLKKRYLVTPRTLPEAKQEAVSAITNGLLGLASSGELKTRQDVTEALTASGFEVVRTTKSSISIADPDGGRNIRLKGAIYEQSFNAGEGLRAEIAGAAATYRRYAESRIQRARAVCKSGTERKREENQRRHQRPRAETDLSYRPDHERDAENRREDMAGHRADVAAADRLELGHSAVAESENPRQRQRDQRAERHADEAERPDVGREIPGGQQRPLPGIAGGDDHRHTADMARGRKTGAETDTGVMDHDRTGNAIIERLRATAAGLRATAERVGSRLLGVAEDVWHYATGEREAERAGEQLKQAGAEFERAAAPVVRQMNAIEQRRELENCQRQELQHEKTLERQRTRSLGNREYGD
ncbi:TPA: plasmid mobilization relaxase MbeA [Enterobacter asburiae]